jgi:hypothetical protein
MKKGAENGKLAMRPHVAIMARMTRTRISLRIMTRMSLMIMTMGKWTRTRTRAKMSKSAVNNSHGRSVKTMEIVTKVLAA